MNKLTPPGQLRAKLALFHLIEDKHCIELWDYPRLQQMVEEQFLVLLELVAMIVEKDGDKS